LLGGAHAGAAVRISLEAGTDQSGPAGMRRRWAVAQAIAPVLTAAFANLPVPGGARTGRRPLPSGGGEPEPRAAWARQVLDAPLSAAPGTFREWIRNGQGRPPTIADLDRHRGGFRAPVTARGHLEIGVADPLPGDGWVVAAAVVTTLVEDSQAASEALAATAGSHGTPHVWERAVRDALADPDIAVAARSLFLSAYGALARRGAPRRMRDAIADYLERYVSRGRCPADDHAGPVSRPPSSTRS
jgi:glutamate--cysteine ligase